jgi:hypothetical protein
MSRQNTNPFSTIDGAQQYLDLLLEAILETRSDIEAKTVEAEGRHQVRTVEALRLATYKLSKLADHVDCSRKLLNDLTKLERILETPEPATAAGAGGGTRY